jgi:hypothetical protein
MLALVMLLTIEGTGAPTKCPTSTLEGGTPALVAADDMARLNFLRDHARRASRRARIWTYSWMGIHGTISATNLALVPVVDRDARVDRYVAASSSGVGFLTAILTRPKVQRTADRLVEIPEGGDYPCGTIETGERLLKEWAADDVKSKSWPVYVGSVAFSVGMGLILGLGYDRWTSAALQTGAGILVGQTFIYTRPRDSIDALERYKAGNLEIPPAPALTLVPFGLGGLAVAGSF